MKKLKSLASVLLLLAMVASLAACSGTESNSPSASTTGAASTSNPTASQNVTAVPDGGSAATDATSASPDGGEAVPDGGEDEFVSRTLALNAMGQFIAGLSPTENYAATNAVFDSVFIMDPKTKTVSSRILEDWYTEDNGLNWILKLKPGVFFSNGEEATGEDLLYTYTAYVERGSGQLNSFGIDWDNCKLIDEMTVNIAFTQPYSGFLYSHQMNFLNKKWCQEVGWESLEWQHPVGSGPYYCETWEQDQQIVLNFREDYWWKEEPYYVDQWIIKIIPDLTTMFMELETGAIDMGTTTATDYAGYVANGSQGDGYAIHLASGGTTVNFYFGMIDRAPLWDDIRMREAIALGIPWAELGQVCYEESYIPADSIATMASPYHITPGVQEYNVEKAMALLAECGYGPDNPLQLSTTQMETDRPMLEPLEFYMSQIGVELDINFVDVATASTIYRQETGNDVAYWFAHRGSAVHELRASIPYAGALYESFEYIPDDEFQEAYWAMQASATDEEMRANSERLQQICFDKKLIIPIAELPFRMGYRLDKFQPEHFSDFCVTTSIIQLGRWGVASAWQ